MCLFGVVTSSPCTFMIFTFLIWLYLRLVSLSSINNSQTFSIQPTPLWQVPMYDLRNEVRRKPCMAQSAAIPWGSPRRPSLTALTAPSSSPFTPQQLVLSPPHLLSPPLGSQLANDSSHSGNQNQCKATLKGFSLGNVVKLLISGPKSGGKLNTSWEFL